jgi:hypothetical protein
MADSSGVQAALAVEAVEWAPGDGDKLTVSIRGRWRRRRPAWRGQPVLAIEAEGRRHRFPAIPEPPSLAGAPPGGWQMTFSVPAWLAPYLGGRIWLQLGVAVVPLPAPVGPLGAPDPALEQAPRAAERLERRPFSAPRSADAEMLIDRRVRTAELAAERAGARAADAEGVVAELTIRVQRLEQELEHARREPQRLRKLIAERDQQRRAAEQRAHAEHALRLELHEALEGSEAAARARARIEAGDLAEAEARVRELEQQLDALRRRADEAEQVAVAAGAGGGQAGSAGFDLSDELAVATRAWPVPVIRRVVAHGEIALTRPPASPFAELRALAGERELIAGRTARGSEELASVLAELRAELEQLGASAEHEYEARVTAERRVIELERRVVELERAVRDRELRSARVYDAVHELRGLLDQARSEGGAIRPAGGSEPPGNVAPERFDAALSRLRAATPREEDREPESLAGLAAQDVAEPPAEPETKAGAWLKPVFARLADRDPAASGRLFVGLLPAQALVHPDAIAYDLVLGERECIQVTVVGSEEGSHVEIGTAGGPRDPGEVAFRVTGDHGQLARLVAAGAVRRRLRRGLARISGDRRALVALTALVRSRLGLHELYEAGVRLEPELAFTLAAAMVRPSWTASERFTIAHDSGAPTAAATYLHVRRGDPPTVTDRPPPGPVATTIVCPDGTLLALLAGDLRDDVTVDGDAGPLLALLGWLERAQRD